MNRRIFFPMSQWDVDHLTVSALFAPDGSDDMRLMMIHMVEANRDMLSAKTRSDLRCRVDRMLFWENSLHRLREVWLELLSQLSQPPRKHHKRRQGLYLTDAEASALFMCAFRSDLEYENSAALLWEQYASQYARILHDPRWASEATRILLERHLIPASDPVKNIHDRYPDSLTIGQGAGREWVRFFRLMRDAGKNNREDSGEERR